MSRKQTVTSSFTDTLRVGEEFALADLDPRSTPGFPGGKTDASKLLAKSTDELADLQERLFAASRAGDAERSLLLVLQGMDTAGKGGIVRHVVGLVDPQGVDIASFKAPTPQEKKEPFLRRIRRRLPEPGRIGVFDRSHYEDVLVARVRNLVPSSTWSRRYGQINTFEKTTSEKGTTIVKVMLHVSKKEQGKRLAERIERPDKRWKYRSGDIDERELWDDYAVAYETMLQRTSTDVAPWFVVPADRKWYARLAVQQLLLEHLRATDPQWPDVDLDVEGELRRLKNS